MGILDRLTTLVRANLNHTLTQAVDPAAAYDGMVQEMRQALDDAQRHLADLTAQQKTLAADQGRCQTLMAEWREKARLAVARGQDDLAREALRRQADYEQAAALYGQQLDAQREVLNQLSADVAVLQTRYDAVRSQRETAIAQQRVAQAQRKIRQALRDYNPFDPQDELAQMEDRIQSSEPAPPAASIPAAIPGLIPPTTTVGPSEEEIERRLEAIKRDLSSKV